MPCRQTTIGLRPCTYKTRRHHVTGDYVRFAPIATSLCSGAICREGPARSCLRPRVASRFWQTLRPRTSHDHGWQPRSRECALLPAVGVWSRPEGGRAMRGYDVETEI